MNNHKKIKWIPVFTREGFPFFILDLGIKAYVYDMKKKIGWGYRDQLFVSKENIETSYYSSRDARSFEKFVSSKDNKFILKINKMIREKFKKAGSDIEKIKTGLKEKDISGEKLAEFLKIFYKTYRDLYSVYRFPTLVDANLGELDKNIINDCAKTKDICGRFFSQVDKTVLRKIRDELSKFLNIKKERVLFMNYDELAESLKKGKAVISADELEKRFEFCILMAVGSDIKMSAGNRAEKIFKELKLDNNLKDIKEIKGQVAYKVEKNIKGRVKIAYTVSDLDKLEKGAILVTPMTTISFVPFIKKASAIVTDEGGITCHAAVVSRELKIPCIIGTKTATKVLKDGGDVEVDGAKGIIRKLN